MQEAMWRKISRIFIKTLGFLVLVAVLSTFLLLLAVQSTTFQTWLGKKAGNYLSNELGTAILVDKINIKFFTKIELHGIYIQDLQKDTLLSGDIDVDISAFKYRERKITLKQTVLKNLSAKLIKQTNQEDFNYQYLVDYFTTAADPDSTTDNWQIVYGDFVLENVAFTYQNKNFSQKVSGNMNYDNLSVKNLSGTIKNFDIRGDTLIADIINLTAKEQSGILVKNLSTQAKVGPTGLLADNLRLSTNHSFLHGKIVFHYSTWSDYTDFINKVQLDCELKDSSLVDTRDIAVFAEELNGLRKSVKISGSVLGTVSDLRLKNIVLNYGLYTNYRGSLQITGLPDIKSTYFHGNAKQLSSNYIDLAAFPAYPFDKGVKLDLPQALQTLGTVAYRGKFDGFITDFTTYGKFSTSLGEIETHLSLSEEKNSGKLKYDGKINTKNLALGKLFKVESLNNVNLSATLKGEGTAMKDMDAEFEVDILSLNYLNYEYKNIHAEGKINEHVLNCMLLSEDKNANLDFNGSIDFNTIVPQIDFISNINALNLNKLNFSNSTDSGIISTNIFISTQGNSIDDLSGEINFDNTIYRTSTRIFKLSSFNLNLSQDATQKFIKLQSEYLNAKLSGKYKLSNIQPMFADYLYTYYPTFFKKPAKEHDQNDSLNFTLTVKKFSVINELFLEDYMLSKGTQIELNFNAAQKKLNITANSGKFEYMSLGLNSLQISLNETNDKLSCRLTANELNLNDTTLVKNIGLTIQSKNDFIDYAILWDNKDSSLVKGEILGKMQFNTDSLRLTIDKATSTANKSTWQLKTSSGIVVNKNGEFSVDTFLMMNNDQEISIYGKYSERKGESLQLQTKNVELSQFNPIISQAGLKLEGKLNSNVVLANTEKVLIFNGELHAQKFKINGSTLGEVVVNANYLSQEKVIELKGHTSLGIGEIFGNPTKDITFQGNYYLDKQEESLDIDFSANPANLKLMNSFLDGILTINHGFVVGVGKVHGTPKTILIDSKLRLVNSEVKFDYTNVTYYITGDIEIMPDQIRFSDLLLRDKNFRSAPQGTLNGNIFHENFNNIKLDYDIVYKNMLVLNTTEQQNSSYYGRVYSSGTVGLFGYLNNLNILVIDTVTRNSKLILPMDGPLEMNDEDYVHFVVRDTSALKKEYNLSGLNLDMFIYITPVAEVSIIMDRITGDQLNVQGQGNLNLKINTLGKFEMFGDYVITEGQYQFSLKTLINKKFAIDAKSHISWSGDPLAAEIDVVTRYKQRASVAPLLDDTTGQYASRQPVDCKLIISGKLATPNIYFDIDVPNLDATAMARIDNVLTDEAELNRQVFSFLLFGNFVKPQIYTSQGGGVSAGDAAAASGSEMLSNKASEFINSYFGNLTGSDMQLGVNYRPSTGSSNQEFDVALSKQFMNNKISVDGNFGVNNSPTNNSTGLIGDVTVDYKISDDGRYRVKVFNRTNDNTQVTVLGGPYTQGIGAFYREEFNSFRELMKRYKVNKK